MCQSHQRFHPVLAVKLMGIMVRNKCWPPFFTLLQPEMPTDGARSGQCDQPISLNVCEKPLPWSLVAMYVCMYVATIRHVSYWVPTTAVAKVTRVHCQMKWSSHVMVINYGRVCLRIPIRSRHVSQYHFIGRPAWPLRNCNRVWFRNFCKFECAGGDLPRYSKLLESFNSCCLHLRCRYGRRNQLQLIRHSATDLRFQAY